MKVYQIQLTRRMIEFMNSPHQTEQTEASRITASRVKAYRDCILFGDVEAAIAFELFEHVADIDADSLESLFHIGNMGPEHKISRLLAKSMRSVSVGDIVVNEQGVHVCKPIGWEQLDTSLAQYFF